MIVRALSLWQPWASLVAWGVKGWETRPWPIRFEGPLAIHATKTEPSAVARYLAGSRGNGPLLAELLDDHGATFAKLPRGAVLALAYAGQLERTEALVARGLDAGEQDLGDFRPGRFAKRLAPVVELPEPSPASGRQGLWGWRVPAELVEFVRELDLAADA